MHSTEDGAPCDRHPPRVDDLIPHATLGVASLGVLHDLAAVLQTLGGAIEELDANLTDPAARALIEDAVEANERLFEVFAASRDLIRDPGRRAVSIKIASLIDRIGQRADRRPIAGAAPPGSVVVAVALVAQGMAMVVSAADTAAGPPELAAAVAAGVVTFTVSAAAAAPPPPALGATLAIAAHAVAPHGGRVRCGEVDGRARYTIELPLAPA